MTDDIRSNAVPQNADDDLVGINPAPAKRELSTVERDRLEKRLVDIREEAALKGRVDAPGVRVAGAPFPIADAEHGYYGVPMLKQPQWSWEVPFYFFVGGAAGASSIIGMAANCTGADQELVRDARFVAAGGAALSSALLISDLGRPSRFLNMLRVFKPQSPMSVGAWVLATFGTLSGAAAFAELVRTKYDVGPVRVIANLAGFGSAMAGLPLATYTGVLIGASVIPVWNHNVKILPMHFGMSGVNSGVSVLELMGHDRSHALNILGIGAAAMETYEGYHLEFARDAEVNEPLKHGVSGWITRAGGVLSGPIPLALRIAAEFVGPHNSRKLRRAAAASSIAGSILTRWGWFRAGYASAKDWRLPMELKDETSREKGPLQSQDDFPRMQGIGD